MHTADPQQFPLHMQLTFTARCYTQFCTQFTKRYAATITAVRSVALPTDWYSDRLLPLLSQLLLIPNSTNTFMDLNVNCSTTCLNQFCWDLIDTWWFGLFSFPIANWTQKALCSSNSGSTVCNSLCLTPLTQCTFNSWQKCFLHQAKFCGSNLKHF